MGKRCFDGLNKIEFVLTNACLGKCKHCSEGDRLTCSPPIDPTVARAAVLGVCKEYDIKTVMVFGGEPLLHRAGVYSIMKVAAELGIEHRQIITSGYFSGDDEEIRRVAEGVASCGVNDLLLSVDSFHQEAIPLGKVLTFARELVAHAVPVRLSPAWLVSREDDNPYNRQTRRILEHFTRLGIPTGEGNVVFPEGRALVYLAEYFKDYSPKNPYVEDPHDVRTLSVSPSGEVLCGNLYTTDIIEIMKKYESDL